MKENFNDILSKQKTLIKENLNISFYKFKKFKKYKFIFNFKNEELIDLYLKIMTKYMIY